MVILLERNLGLIRTPHGYTHRRHLAQVKVPYQDGVFVDERIKGLTRNRLHDHAKPSSGYRVRSYRLTQKASTQAVLNELGKDFRPVFLGGYGLLFVLEQLKTRLSYGTRYVAPTLAANALTDPSSGFPMVAFLRMGDKKDHRHTLAFGHFVGGWDPGQDEVLHFEEEF